MNPTTIRTLAALALGLALVLPAHASDQGHGGSMKGMEMKGQMGKGAMKGMDMKGGMDMARMGRAIHESTVDGHKLAYRVIDMKEKMESMKGMKGMSMKGMDMSQMKSHHLMVFVTGADGHEHGEGKVGYKVTGPDGSEQKAMAMGMKGGFGADVDFGAKGTYTIKTKVVLDEATLVDEFTYKVE